MLAPTPYLWVLVVWPVVGLVGHLRRLVFKPWAATNLDRLLA